jgi:hypothetical protein
MKPPSFFHSCRAVCAAVALGTLAFLPAAHADDAPRIDALRVAKMAADYLATCGKDAPYIVSIVLEKDALLRGKTSWVVRWSRPIPLEGDKEIGMRVRPDGSVTHIVADKSGPKRRGVQMQP